ncbi:MAG: SigB/SigF/SigG family RNA polymerase sigma factor [Pseudonocardiales bacterium]|nr:SigB/SigF/SigG family RNA polymerase sigma factor [Pseudonocardiales bacterium]MBV9728207.1 SigB/SigF/SigG family RNA polymerase sigma factor [Pseudonocardiales bacterium]
MTPSTESEEGTADEGTGYAHLVPLFAELAELDSGNPRWAEVRDQLVVAHLPLAQHIAHRFSHRGEPQDDLVQVATIGLIHAVDRFSPDRGSDFLSFAVPTITGEVRRYFRDHAWALRVPRRLKDLHLAIGSAISVLSQQRGRAPTASELAEYLKLPREQILEGLEAAGAYRASSLDSLVDAEGTGSAPDEVVDVADAELDRVEYRTTLAPLLERLPERECTIIKLRFFAGLTQSQIAQRIGLSQMHVSRLLSRTLARLREELAREP